MDSYNVEQVRQAINGLNSGLEVVVEMGGAQYGVKHIIDQGDRVILRTYRLAANPQGKKSIPLEERLDAALGTEPINEFLFGLIGGDEPQKDVRLPSRICFKARSEHDAYQLECIMSQDELGNKVRVCRWVGERSDSDPFRGADAVPRALKYAKSHGWDVNKC